MCTVVWYRNGQRNELLIETPKTNEQLTLKMLEHRVGASEIRAVKSLDGTALAKSIQMRA